MVGEYFGAQYFAQVEDEVILRLRLVNDGARIPESHSGRDITMSIQLVDYPTGSVMGWNPGDTQHHVSTGGIVLYEKPVEVVLSREQIRQLNDGDPVPVNLGFEIPKHISPKLIWTDAIRVVFTGPEEVVDLAAEPCARTIMIGPSYRQQVNVIVFWLAAEVAAGHAVAGTAMSGTWDLAKFVLDLEDGDTLAAGLDAWGVLYTVASMHARGAASMLAGAAATLLSLPEAIIDTGYSLSFAIMIGRAGHNMRREQVAAFWASIGAENLGAAYNLGMLPVELLLESHFLVATLIAGGWLTVTEAIEQGLI